VAARKVRGDSGYLDGTSVERVIVAGPRQHGDLRDPGRQRQSQGNPPELPVVREIFRLECEHVFRTNLVINPTFALRGVWES
jgi:hypothetical protein